MKKNISEKKYILEEMKDSIKHRGPDAEGSFISENVLLGHRRLIVVDALGGIDVESDIAFTTGKDSGVIMDIQEGKNHLNGKEALAFVRERKAFIDGDNQRGKNHQALLTALIRKAFSPMIIFQMNSVIDGIVGNAETNMTEGQIKSLIRMQLEDLKGWSIESVAASGDDSGKQYCYSYSAAPLYVTVPDVVVVEEIKRKMMEIIEEAM